MNESKQKKIPREYSNLLGDSGISRKDFLKYAGAGGAAVATLGLIGCEDDEGLGGGMEGDVVDLGSGDFGVLNYAYALEQLEAAFYIQVESNPYDGMTEAEGQVFADIRDHEVAHRDFYAAALADNAIPGLTPNFSAIDFSSKASVVGTAFTYENVGVSAYNGAGALLTDATFLLVAGKIVSVEARHAAAISDILVPEAGVTSDPNTIGDNGLDLARSVSEVLDLVAPFIEEEIDASGLPQS